MLVASFAFAQEEELSDTVTWSEEVEWEEEYINKKDFDDATYNELKKEVELVEEIAKRKLKSDSSEFGTGYGVEYGKDYYVWDFDSVSGGVNVGEEDRRSGGDFKDDGVRGDARDKGYRRNNTRRTENKGRHGAVGKQSTRTGEKPKRKQNQSASGRDGDIGSFFFILFMAVVVGAIVYFIFIN